MKPARLGFVLLALLLAPAYAQEEATEHGSVEIGYRHIWGEVYGRPDLLPYQPDVSTSKFNEYRDLRSGAFLRNFNLRLRDIFGSRVYLNAQTTRTFYDDQSALVSFGSYGRFKVSFRWDEIPHLFTNTARTNYVETSPGVFRYPDVLRTTLETFPNNDPNLPAFIAGNLVGPANPFAGNPLFLPQLKRRAGTGTFSINITPAWNFNFLFSRENQVGYRPIAVVLNSSPSTTITSGYGVELPEPIDYITNTLKVGTEYAEPGWGMQFFYLFSSFHNNIGALRFDNPFRTTDCIVAANCVPAGTSTGSAEGVLDLYPDNQAHYLIFNGAVDLGKHARFLASVSPGWLSQDDALLPYTSNQLRLAQTGPLPVNRLDARKQTLAMNYSVVANPLKNVQFKVGYRQYDYNNLTEEHEWTPVQGDTSAPDTAENRIFSYDKKTVEVTGNWYFMKRSSLKLGYEGEWFDRENRDVRDSLENSLIAAVDFSPIKDLQFRLGYRYANRDPEHYEDELAVDDLGAPIECEEDALIAARAAFIVPGTQPCARRFDESARIRHRADFQAQYSPLDRLTVGVFAGTVQDDYNRPGGTNSATPLNFLSGAAATTGPYYLYGMLKDISTNYGADLDITVANDVTLFAEYSHENYHKRMVSRYRAPQSTSGTVNGCGPNSLAVANRGPCDSANNDWESVWRDKVDIWAAGVDLYLAKQVYVTTYYSLSAAKGLVHSRPLGDPIGHPNQPLANDPDRFMLVGTNAAVDYPDTVSRIHEVAAIFKFKATKNLMPKFEYRYQRFDNRDYQTTPMTQFLGCVSPAGTFPGTVPGCPTPILDSATSPTPVAFPSEFYPYFVVGDTSAARYLFLGVDQPSYKTHYAAVSVEFHF